MNVSDFQHMLQDKEQGDALLNSVKQLASYNAEQLGIRDSVKETLDDLVAFLKVEKEDAAAIKKYVRKAAAAYGKHEMDQLLNEQSAIEMLIARLDGQTGGDED